VVRACENFVFSPFNIHFAQVDWLTVEILVVEFIYRNALNFNFFAVLSDDWVVDTI
jgi:hypothetical protein